MRSGLHASSARVEWTAGYVTVIANKFNLEGTKLLHHRLCILIPNYNDWYKSSVKFDTESVRLYLLPSESLFLPSIHLAHLPHLGYIRKVNQITHLYFRYHDTEYGAGACISTWKLQISMETSWEWHNKNVVTNHQWSSVIRKLHINEEPNRCKIEVKIISLMILDKTLNNDDSVNIDPC